MIPREADAFLDAIDARPGDDTPRLVYADWLEESGYADYARFIRLSCRLARTVLPPDERTRLRRERFLLSREIERANPQAFDGHGSRLSYYDYGIPNHSLAIHAEAFVRNWPHWWPFFSPRALYLYDVSGCEDAVARCGYLSRVDMLRCEGRANGMTFDGHRERVEWQPVSGILLRGLATNPELGRLSTLQVSPIEATADDLRAFAKSPLLGRLKELHLWKQLADGSRQDLDTFGDSVARDTAQFLAEYGDCLPSRPALV